jgi:hypothetical protein
MRLQDKRIIFGVDYDSADELIQNGYVRDMLNCMVTSIQGEDSVVTNLKGTKNIFDELGFSLPSGENKCIGSYSSNDARLLFWFNWNSNNNHGVYSYDGTIIKTLILGDLGWIQDKSIHSVALVGELLYWSEGLSINPRYLNINTSLTQFEEFNISVAKRPPLFPLVVRRQNITNSIVNEYDKSTYYFTYRYVYKDGQQSTFAPYSKMVSSAYLQTVKYGNVEVFINSSDLLKIGSAQGLKYNSDIKYIEFAYANTYLGPFKLINRIKVLDVLTSADFINIPSTNDCIISPTGQLGIRFSNEFASTVLDSSDTSTPFSSIFPCETLTTVDNRLVIANTKEGVNEFDITVKNITEGFEDIGFYFQGTDTPSIREGNYTCFKPYSKYALGIVFYNEIGQKSGVKRLLNTTVPADFGVLEEKYWAANFEIEGTPPDWATHYQIVRTDNLSSVRFIQGIANDVKFVSGYLPNGDPVFIKKIIGYTPPGFNTGGLIGAWDSYHTVKEGYQSATDAGEISSYFYDGQPIYEGGVDTNGVKLYPIRISYNIFGNIVSTRINNTFVTFDNSGNGHYATTVDNYQIYIDGRYGLYATGQSIPKTTTNVSLGFNNIIVGTNTTGIRFVSGPMTGKPINSFYPSGLKKAVDVLIDVYNWNNSTIYTTGRAVGDYITNPSNETPYVFEEGDRLNIYYSPIGEYLGIMDYEIKSFEEGRYIKAKYREEFSQSLYYGTGTFIEITTPRSNENTDIFYEFGECYPVNNPGTNQRSLSRTSFKIWQGDTHRMKEVPLYAKNLIVSNETKPYYFYSMSPDYKKRTGVWEKANGRPNLVLLDGNNKVRKVNTIRWSDRLIDGSKINGNSTFGAFNSIQLDFDFGPIRKVTGVEEVMIVNCESESSVIYVNESLLKSADNEGIVAISNNVLNSPRKLPGGYGCIHPESVALYNNYLYWVSDNKGTAIRYNTVNGIFNISGGYKAKTYFYNKKPSWIGGFDPLFRMQLFCSDETIGFLDPADPDTPNAWTGRYSFVPERLGYLGLDLLSFKDGVLWKHHSSDIYNNFYGQQYQSEITPIFNFQPSDIKVFNSVSIEASDSFVGEISTLEGQSSRILEMEKINQEWWSDILRDENTGGLYEGDLITSHILKIKFIYNKISKFRLRFINLYSQISQLTNK